MKYDIPNSQLANYERYNVLLLKGDSRTLSEESEFTNLQTILNPYMVTAQDFNKVVDYKYLISLTNDYEGVSIDYTWVDGLPSVVKHYDDVNKTGNIIKQIDYVWSNGLPQTETYTLKEFDAGNNVIDTKTYTVTYTWLDGLPTGVNIS